MTDQQIVDFLSHIKTIAVVGLSDNPIKASYRVASYLQSQGYEITPVNPNANTVLGKKAYPTLRDVPTNVDLVNVFRPSDEAVTIVEDAIAMEAKGVWLQLGIINSKAEQLARDHGLFVVSDRCIMTLHQRLLSRKQI